MTSDSNDMLRAVTVNDRGQLVIPEEMRQALGIEDEAWDEAYDAEQA